MRRLHILVVDDDDNMLALWVRRLRKHRLTLAHNGSEAIGLLSRDVDVVLSDLDMPVMDGISLLRQVKKLLPGASRFLCTGSPPDIAEAAVSAGIADRYFPKPGNPGEVTAAIDEVGEAPVRGAAGASH